MHGRHVDDDLAGLHGREQAAGAPHQVLDRGVIAQAIHHQVGARHSLGNGGRFLGALLHQRRTALGCAIPDGNRVAGLEQVSRHAASHRSHAQISNLLHLVKALSTVI